MNKEIDVREGVINYGMLRVYNDIVINSLIEDILDKRAKEAEKQVIEDKETLKREMSRIRKKGLKKGEQ